MDAHINVMCANTNHKKNAAVCSIPPTAYDTPPTMMATFLPAKSERAGDIVQLKHSDMHHYTMQSSLFSIGIGQEYFYNKVCFQHVVYTKFTPYRYMHIQLCSLCRPEFYVNSSLYCDAVSHMINARLSLLFLICMKESWRMRLQCMSHTTQVPLHPACCEWSFLLHAPS